MGAKEPGGREVGGARLLPRVGAVSGNGGVLLRWRFWEASQPRAAALLVHGLGDHSARYDHVGAGLAEAGIHLLAFDLRGHGGSGGRRGDVGEFRLYLDDLKVMEEVLAVEAGGSLPSFLLGHSLGGLIALLRLRSGPVPYAGAVLSAPWIATALPPIVCRFGGWLGGWLPGVRVPMGLRPEALSRDPAMVHARRKDPDLQRSLTLRLFREALLAQREVLEWSGPYGCPLLFLVPTADGVVRSAATLAVARGIVGGEVRVEILEGGRHEPFHDVHREAVLALVVRWLLERCADDRRTAGAEQVSHWRIWGGK